MNKTAISICEWEAIAFFGSEPVSREYGTKWFDSDSLYEVTDKNGLKLSCALHPIHKDVRLCLYQKEKKFYAWQAQDLEDICYIEEKERTILKIVVSQRDSLILQVSPEISINRKTEPGRAANG